MADDITNSDMQDVYDTLKLINERFSITSDELKKLARGSKEFGTAQKALTKNLTKDFDELSEKVKDGTDTLEEHQTAVKNVNKALKVMEDGEEKRELRRQLQASQVKASSKAVEQAFSELTTQAGTVAVAGIGTFVKGLQSGSSTSQLAAGLMSAGVDVAASGAVGIGKALQGAAPAIMMLGPWGRFVGAALAGIGMAAESAAPAVAKLVKFGIEYLSVEVEKLQKSFNQLSANGAMFSDGMTGMVKAAGGAGLTIEQFSNVVKSNSETLALAGGGITANAKKVGEVGKIFDKNGGQVRKQLLALGYSFEEQAEITAQVISNIGRTGNKATTEQIATETQKYAENLRLISNITGADAKSKIKQVEEQNQILAFQNEIAKLGPEQAAQINASMAAMTEMDQKAIRDRVIYHGMVASKDVAMYEATNAGATKQNEEIYKLIKQGRATTQSVGLVQQQYADQIIAGARANQAIGIGAYATQDASLQAVAAANLEAIKRSQQMKGMDAAIVSVEAQKVTQDGLTLSLIESELALQNMKKTIQGELIGKNGALEKFAKVTASIVTTLEDILISLGMASDALRAKRDAPAIAQQAYTAGIAKTQQGLGQENLHKMPYESDVEYRNRMIDLAKRSGNDKFGNITPSAAPRAELGISNPPKYETGGIASGPMSGHQALLHGTEAVVPLPDNRSIPVSLESSSLTTAIERNSGLLSDMISEIRKGNSISSGILQNTY